MLRSIRENLSDPPPPVGVGGRDLGAVFAEHGLRIVLARVPARFDVEVAPGCELGAEARSIAAYPSAGSPVILRPRMRSAETSAA